MAAVAALIVAGLIEAAGFDAEAVLMNLGIVATNVSDVGENHAVWSSAAQVLEFFSAICCN